MQSDTMDQHLGQSEAQIDQDKLQFWRVFLMSLII